MRNGLMLMGWITLLTLLTACGTSQDTKDRPRVGVIGHGTTPGYSWAGMGVTVPFPGIQTNAPSPPSRQDSIDSGKLP